MQNANQIITLDTLFTTYQYKIFAVLLQDSKSKIEHYFSIQETSFTNNDQFMKYVADLRDRSLYDFNDVDVKESDELLILYTCSPKSVARFEDARLAVVARKVRNGEAATVSNKITVNKDVIMPYRWYTAQKKTPHSVYGGGTNPTTTVAPTETTTITGVSAPTTVGDEAATSTTAAPTEAETTTAAEAAQTTDAAATEPTAATP